MAAKGPLTDQRLTGPFGNATYAPYDPLERP
jgi:hypothetical protein